MVRGLALAKEMGVVRIICQTDLRLTVGHLTGEFQVKDTLLCGKTSFHLSILLIMAFLLSIFIKKRPLYGEFFFYLLIC